MRKLKGVVLLTFGGPDSLEAVEPFMTSIMGGRKPPSPLLNRLLERYRLIGGKSPLPDVSREQAQLLSRVLNKSTDTYRVYVGMLHAAPMIKDAVVQMIKDGVDEIIALSLSAHFAGVTTGSYAKAITRAQEELGCFLPVKSAAPYYESPLFVQGLFERLKTALDQFPAAAQPQVEVIFTAHSLPQAHILAGDPYPDQLAATAKALAKKAKLAGWHLAYQSKGGGQGEWLGPEVETVMDDLAAQGKRYVLVSPIGFTTDHIETLYDIDVSQKLHAQSLGLEFKRAAALNTSDKFIQALAKSVLAAK